VFVAATMPAVLLFLALAWDVSGYLRALHRADAVAAEAARAAGQAIDVPMVMTGRGIAVDPALAREAAEAYLAGAGLVDVRVSGQVEVAADGRRLSVTVEVDYQPLLLGAFGFQTPPVATGHADAHLVDG
jgi:hypothetical protein